MRILFVWMTYEPYFGACWRALSARDGIDLEVWALRPETSSLSPHGPDVLHDLNTDLMPEHELTDGPLLLGKLIAADPDVVVLPGWQNRGAIRALSKRAMAHVAVVMAVDTQWKGTLRQRAGRWTHRRFFRRVDAVVVAAERSWQLARRLGFEERRLHRGMYGIDLDALSPVAAARAAGGPWPRRFLYVGRLLELKGARELAEAYRLYVDRVRQLRLGEPWPLTCCGAGPEEPLLRDAGADLVGFMQWRDLIDRGLWAGGGAFLMLSRYDAWCQAMVEAMAAGLPVVCTEAVGASVELVRNYFNGLVVPTRNPASAADAMLWMHQNAERLPEMGARSRELASAYAASLWAERWDHACRAARAARPPRSPQSLALRHSRQL